MNGLFQRKPRYVIVLIMAGLVSIGLGMAWRIYTDSKIHIENLDELRIYESAWKTLNGPPISVSDLNGKRVLINFWGSWCPPCVAEMPLLDEMNSTYSNQNFMVLGFAVDSDQAALTFLNEHEIRFFSLISDAVTADQIIQHLGNKERVLPYSVFFAENGTLESSHYGEFNRDQLLALIN